MSLLQAAATGICQGKGFVAAMEQVHRHRFAARAIPNKLLGGFVGGEDLFHYAVHGSAIQVRLPEAVIIGALQESGVCEGVIAGSAGISCGRYAADRGVGLSVPASFNEKVGAVLLLCGLPF